MDTAKQFEYERKIASLESKLDFMQTELVTLNERLVECGFDQGIRSLIETIDEIEAAERLIEEGEWEF